MSYVTDIYVVIEVNICYNYFMDLTRTRIRLNGLGDRDTAHQLQTATEHALADHRVEDPTAPHTFLRYSGVDLNGRSYKGIRHNRPLPGVPDELVEVEQGSKPKDYARVSFMYELPGYAGKVLVEVRANTPADDQNNTASIEIRGARGADWLPADLLLEQAGPDFVEKSLHMASACIAAVAGAASEK